MHRPADPHLSHVLYQALIMGKHHLPTVARRAGISYDVLLKLCHGKGGLRAEDLPKIYRATQDRELYAELAGVAECDLLLVQRTEATGGFKRPESITLAIASAAGNVAQLVADANRDETITEEEAKSILAGLEALERRAVALRQKLKVVGAGQ